MFQASQMKHSKSSETSRLQGKDAPSRARQLLESDDVIFATVRPALRRVAMIPQELHEQVCSTGFCVLRANKQRLNPRFLYYFLLSEEVRQRVEALQTGATYPAINDGDLLRMAIPLPPLSEQGAITQILQTVQEAKETRQRELALERERKGALMEHLLAHGTSNEGDFKQDGTLPSGWNLVLAGEELIAEGPQNGIYKHQDAYGSGTLILRINDFDNEGMLVTTTLNRVRLNSEESTLYQLREGDILINRVNSLSHLGKSLLVRDVSESTVFESNMMRLRVDESKVLPGYFCRHLLTESTRNYMRGRAKRAVAQSSVNQGDIRSISFCSLLFQSKKRL